MSRRPGFLSRYAKHAKISINKAAYQLQQCGINYHAFFDFAEADRRREQWGLLDEQLESDSPEPGDTPPLAAAKARERHFKAGLAELEYRQRIGELVEVDKVEAEAFRIGRLVRDAILNIPSRLAGILAAESDQRRVYELLEKEHRQALDTLSCDDEPGVQTSAHDGGGDHGRG